LDATEVFDDVINQFNAVSTSIYILVFAVVVVLIVLGLEFWRNFFGMLGSPGITFQRLIGEVSLPPAIFVVIVAGFLMAITTLAIWTDRDFGDSVVAQFNIAFDWMEEQDTEGMLPDEIDFVKWFSNLQRDIAYMLSFFVLMPIACLVIWALGGVGFHLASLLAGNKGGGSVAGMLTASAYPYIPAVMVILLALRVIYAGWLNMALLVIFTLYFIFLWTLLMREYGRYDYVKSFISFIIGVVFTAILVAVVTMGILWIAAFAMSYLG
jgi:hypothetical protein